MKFLSDADSQRTGAPVLVQTSNDHGTISPNCARLLFCVLEVENNSAIRVNCDRFNPTCTVPPCFSSFKETVSLRRRRMSPEVDRIARGVARVAKATPISSKKKLQGKNNLFYLQHLHCTLNCTQSFNGGETPGMS